MDAESATPVLFTPMTWFKPMPCPHSGNLRRLPIQIKHPILPAAVWICSAFLHFWRCCSAFLLSWGYHFASLQMRMSSHTSFSLLCHYITWLHFGRCSASLLHWGCCSATLPCWRHCSAFTEDVTPSAYFVVYITPPLLLCNKHCSSPCFVKTDAFSSGLVVGVAPPSGFAEDFASPSGFMEDDIPPLAWAWLPSWASRWLSLCSSASFCTSLQLFVTVASHELHLHPPLLPICDKFKPAVDYFPATACTDVSDLLNTFCNAALNLGFSSQMVWYWLLQILITF